MKYKYLIKGILTVCTSQNDPNSSQQILLDQCLFHQKCLHYPESSPRHSEPHIV